MAHPTRSFADRLAVLCGTGLGVGFIPWAPGTFGSLWGPVVFGFLLGTGWPVPVLIGSGLAFIAIGIPICTRASRVLGKHDPGAVVYDEIAAFWLVFLPQIVEQRPLTATSAIAGFLLFRVFDIWKPWPCKKLEALPEGLGIMADDLAAGCYSAACLYALERLL